MRLAHRSAAEGGLPSSSASAASTPVGRERSDPQPPCERSERPDGLRAEGPSLEPSLLPLTDFLKSAARIAAWARRKPPGAGGPSRVTLVPGERVSSNGCAPPSRLCDPKGLGGLMVWCVHRTQHRGAGDDHSTIALLRGCRPMAAKDCSGSNPGASRWSVAHRPTQASFPAGCSDPLGGATDSSHTGVTTPVFLRCDQATHGDQRR